MMLLATTALSPQPSPLLLDPSSSSSLSSPTTAAAFNSPLPRSSPRLSRPAMYTSNSTYSSYDAEGVNGTPLDFSDPPQVIQARAQAAATAAKEQATNPQRSPLKLPRYSTTGYPFPYVLTRPPTPDLNAADANSYTDLHRLQLGDDLATQFSSWSSSTSGSTGVNTPASCYSDAGANSAAGTRDRDSESGVTGVPAMSSWYSPALTSSSVSEISGYTSSPFFGAPRNQRSPRGVSTGESSPALPSTSPEDAWKLKHGKISPPQVVAAPTFIASPQPPTHPPTPIEDIVSRSKDAGCTPGATGLLPFVHISDSREGSKQGSTKPEPSPPPPPSMAPSQSTLSSKAASKALKRARLGLSLSLSGLDVTPAGNTVSNRPNVSREEQPNDDAASSSTSTAMSLPPQELQHVKAGPGQSEGIDGSAEGSAMAVSAAALSLALGVATDARPVISSPLREAEGPGFVVTHR